MCDSMLHDVRRTGTARPTGRAPSSSNAPASSRRTIRVAVLARLVLVAAAGAGGARAATSVVQSGATLSIRGDAAANTVLVTGQSFVGRVAVRIDGGDVLEFAAVRDVRVDLKGGDDRVSFLGVRIGGSVSVRGGAGADEVRIAGEDFVLGPPGVFIGGDVDVRLGNQPGDRMRIDSRADRGTVIGGSLRIIGASSVLLDGNGGGSGFQVGDVLIGRDLRLQSRIECQANLEDVNVCGRTKLALGDGDDRIAVSKCFFAGKFTVHLSGGDDRLDLDDTSSDGIEFDSLFDIDGGPGVDVLDQNPANHFNASSGRISGIESTT